MANKLAYITPIGSTGRRLEGGFNVENTNVLPAITENQDPNLVYPTTEGSRIQVGVIVPIIPLTPSGSPRIKMYLGNGVWDYVCGCPTDSDDYYVNRSDNNYVNRAGYNYVRRAS